MENRKEGNKKRTRERQRRERERERERDRERERERERERQKNEKVVRTDYHQFRMTAPYSLPSCCSSSCWGALTRWWPPLRQRFHANGAGCAELLGDHHTPQSMGGEAGSDSACKRPCRSTCRSRDIIRNVRWSCSWWSLGGPGVVSGQERTFVWDLGLFQSELTIRG